MIRSGIPAILAAALLGSGCATTPSVANAPPAARAEPRQVTVIRRDEGYIARVEREARKRGVSVSWVNPPTKRIARTTR